MKKTILSFCSLLISLASFSQINTSHFAAPVGFQVFSTTGSINLASADINNDGKIDVAVANQANGTLSLFRNIGTQGVINSSTFATKFDILIGSTSNTLNYLKFVKLDNDNLIDLVISTGSGNSIAALRNTSDTITGAISFATPVMFTAQSNTVGIDAADVDGDGKNDVVVANYASSSLSVFRNTTTGTTLSFATPVNYSSGLSSPNQLLLADLDLDNRKDIVIFNFGSNITRIYQNNSSPGTIFFSNTGLTLTGGAGVFRGDVGDIDKDGKPEIIASSYSSATTSVYRNSSTIGSFSFAAGSSYSAPYVMQSARLCDLNGDGSPEMFQTCGGNPNAITICENFATKTTPGILYPYYTAPISLTSSGNGFTGMDFADIDRDGKTDILAVTYGAPTTLYVYKSSVPTATPLMSRYSFNGNLADSSGFNNHIATLPSGCAMVPDRWGTANSAVSFDGTNNAYLQPSNANAPQHHITTIKNLTVTAWIKPTAGSTGSNLRTITNFFDAGTQLHLSLDASTGKLVWANNSGAWPNPPTYWTTSSKSSITPGYWYHVALCFDSLNRVSFYINGALDTTIQWPTNPLLPQTTATYYIGQNAPMSPVMNPWLGVLDEVNVYRKILTPAQIAAMYDYYSFYYAAPSGPLNVLSSWGSNANGTGTAPTSFNLSNTLWQVTNNASPTITADWAVSGSNSAIVVNSGYNLVVPSGMNLGTDSLVVLNNATLTVNGNAFFNKSYFDTLSTAQYLGSQPQTLYGKNYFNLTLMGSTKTTIGNLAVRNFLTLASSLNAGSFAVTVGSGGNQTGAINQFGGYIMGRLVKWINPTTGNLSLTLPIGNSTAVYPLQLTFTGGVSSPGTLTTQFIPSLPGNGGLPLFDFSIAPIVQVTKTAQNGYWQLAAGNGLSMGSAQFTLNATGTGFWGVNNLSALRLLTRTNSGSGPWTLAGQAGTNSGTTTSPVVVRSALNTFGDFVIAGDSSVNPLPVSWLSFEAGIVEQGVQLYWSTAAEQQNEKFEVERSDDGEHFTAIGSVAGKGNTTQVSKYSFLDADAQGLEKGLFYRIAQTDADGSVDYSRTLMVQSRVNKVSIAPNPANEWVEVSGLSGNIHFYDMLGNAMKVQQTGSRISLSGLPAGVYLLECSGRYFRVQKN